MRRSHVVRYFVLVVVVGVLGCVGVFLYLGELDPLLDLAEVIGALMELI